MPVRPLFMAALASHRSRGAWIEIIVLPFLVKCNCRRIAHAVRGLKSFDHQYERERKSRIAHAVRGLKLIYFFDTLVF